MDVWPTDSAPRSHPKRIQSPQLDTTMRSVEFPNQFEKPKKQISKQSDIDFFIESEAFDRLMNFIAALNEDVKGKKISSIESQSERVQSIVAMLEKLDRWIDEIPPSEQPQRFGNKSFRIWMERVEKKSEQILSEILPLNLKESVIELREYWINSFGNSTRIDYGSGHEMNFVAFLCCLTLIEYFQSSDHSAIVLVIFNRYLELVRKLQRTYQLEPAGSHGVWGLDDYQFLSYLWGSAQFVGHQYMKPKSSIEEEIVNSYHREYLYLAGIKFINEMKRGPFHEHSPMLYDISGVSSWQKVNKGLIKMYIAEVLKKVPIVQHFEFGNLLPYIKRKTR